VVHLCDIMTQSTKVYHSVYCFASLESLILQHISFSFFKLQYCMNSLSDQGSVYILTFSVWSTPYGVAVSKVEMTEVHHLVYAGI
jgi:hypothetical protein